MEKKRRIVLWLLMLLILSGLFFLKQGISLKHYANVDNGWNLILVNKNNYIPKNYEFELTELSNGEKVDSRIYPSLQKMFDAARVHGLSLHVSAGYRSEEAQQQLMEEKIEAFELEGHSSREAKRMAEKWVAVPGTSEHQIGIAVDINADRCAASPTLYSWLAKNSYKYGFIQRYPPDKNSVTGISYEPWHYRYVGKEAATEMHSRGLCLEEYIDGL